MNNEIKRVRASDAGRIVVSDSGFPRVKFMSISRVDDKGNIFAVVEDLEHKGDVIGDFHLVGGYRAMYWEDEIKKPVLTLDISSAVHASQTVNQIRDEKDVMNYLAAETGECADWLVNPDRRKEDLLGECADVIICALDLALVHKKATSALEGEELAEEVVKDLNYLLKQKSQKWIEKHANV